MTQTAQNAAVFGRPLCTKALLYCRNSGPEITVRTCALFISNKARARLVSASWNRVSTNALLMTSHIAHRSLRAVGVGQYTRKDLLFSSYPRMRRSYSSILSVTRSVRVARGMSRSPQRSRMSPGSARAWCFRRQHSRRVAPRKWFIRRSSAISRRSSRPTWKRMEVISCLSRMPPRKYRGDIVRWGDLISEPDAT